MSILILDDDGVRRQIIEGIASGLTMAEVSVKVGVDTTTIHSYRCADQEFDRVVVDASFAVGGTVSRCTGRRLRIRIVCCRRGSLTTS